eukprot:m.213515 g.213515  ORF g.213515 m.213515 type:complete len:1075 (-) comp15085_c0_seq1:291-3515(-)
MATYSWSNGAGAWAGAFHDGILKILKQVHPQGISINQEAMDLLDSKLFTVLAHFCDTLAHNPHMEHEDILSNVMPDGDLFVWAVDESLSAVDAYQQLQAKRRVMCQFALDKFHKRLETLVFREELDILAVLFMLSALDYIAADALKLAGNFASNCGQEEITYQTLDAVLRADQELSELFSLCETLPIVQVRLDLTFPDAVREFVEAEKSFLAKMEDLESLRTELETAGISEDILARAFHQIPDLTETIQSLVSDIDEAVDSAELSGTMPMIEEALREFMEDREYMAFLTFAGNLQTMIGEIDSLSTDDGVLKQISASDTSLALAAKYELKRLFYEPLLHFRHLQEAFFNIISLGKLSKTITGDLETLAQTIPWTSINPKKFSGMDARNYYLQLPSFTKKMLKITRDALLSSVECDADCPLKLSGHILYEGDVMLKTQKRSKPKPNRIIVCHEAIYFLKPLDKGSMSARWKFKESYKTKNAILDLHSSSDSTIFLSINQPGEPEPIYLRILAPTTEDFHKCCSALAHGILSRYLQELQARRQEELERSLASFQPSPDKYIFSTPDEIGVNIVFAENTPGGTPIVKAATLAKLIERLTYPAYADPDFSRHFLITYRAFCTPEELFELLTKRYAITPPEHLEHSVLKKFNQLYALPIKLRVVNVLRKWLEKHYYDFQRREKLLVALLRFVKQEVQKGNAIDRQVRSWQGVLNLIKKNQAREHETKVFSWPQGTVFPPIVWLGDAKPSFAQYHILTLHPVELARQISLIEQDLFRAVQPSELVDCVWSKPDREQLSPNVVKIQQWANNLSYFIIRSIVELSDLDERIHAISLWIEVAIELVTLKNFNGTMAIIAAFQSSAVFRLKHTWAGVSSKRTTKLQDIKSQLSSDHNYSALRAVLQTIAPPCLPYFGMYLTDITFAEQAAKKDRDPSAQHLINFAQRRIIAKLCTTIQQFQRSRFQLEPEPSIQHYLYAMPPLLDTSVNLPSTKSDVEAFDQAMYKRSQLLEPRNAAVEDLQPGTPYLSSPEQLHARRSVLVNKLRHNPTTKKKISAATPPSDKAPRRLKSQSSLEGAPSQSSA